MRRHPHHHQSTHLAHARRRLSVCRKRMGGFTLAEVMVAVAILAFIGLLTFGTFSRALMARDKAEQITDRYHQIRQAMLRMADEISMAFISTHRSCDDPRTRTIFAVQREAGGMRLDFTSFSHMKISADANESDQNELSFYVDDDPNNQGKMALLRREQARIDDDPKEGGTVQVLAEGVTHLDFAFYDAKQDRWDDFWDTSRQDYRNRLPMFVTIRMTALDPQGKEEKFVTKTRVYLQFALLIPGTGFAQCLD